MWGSFIVVAVVVVPLAIKGMNVCMYVCFYVETTTIKHLPANSIPQIVLPVFSLHLSLSLSV